MQEADLESKQTSLSSWKSSRGEVVDWGKRWRGAGGRLGRCGWGSLAPGIPEGHFGRRLWTELIITSLAWSFATAVESSLEPVFSLSLPLCRGSENTIFFTTYANGSCSKYILVPNKSVLLSIHSRTFWVVKGRNIKDPSILL